VFPKKVFAPHSLGTFPLLEQFGPTAVGLGVGSLIAIAGMLLLAYVRCRLRLVAVTVIAALFLASSTFTYFSAIVPLQDRVARTTSLAAYIQTYIGSPATIAYDTAFYHPLTYFTYEYLLPHSRLIPFDSSVGEAPPAPIVISGTRWRDAAGLGAQFWQAEPNVTTVGASQALWTLPGAEQSDLLQGVDYANTVLSISMLPTWSISTPLGTPVQPAWAVWQQSFYHYEQDGRQTALVWFDNDAAVRVPMAQGPPQAILINLNNPADVEKPLQIGANGEPVYDGPIPAGNWCETFPFNEPTADNVTIAFFRPMRELILLRGITVLDHLPEPNDATPSGDPLSLSGYRSELALEAPLNPQSLVRGAMGTVRVTVTNAGDQAWTTECEIGNTPGIVKLGILWFPRDSSGRTLSDRVAEGRAPLPYMLAPGRSISLTAILSPARENGNPLPPGDYEVWIGPVQEGVAWFFQHGDEVLRVPVSIRR
jgi:hypothetical protein